MRIRLLVAALLLFLPLALLRQAFTMMGEAPARPDQAAGKPLVRYKTPAWYPKDTHDLPMLPAASAIRCPIAPEADEGAIAGLAFAPDGKALAAGNIHGVVKVFDPATGRLLAGFRALDPVEGPCDALAFSPDGRALAVEFKQFGQVATVDPTSGRLLREMEVIDPRASLGVTVLAFSPDGTILAGGSDNGEVVLWDAATGRRLQVIPPQIIPAEPFGGDRIVPPHPAPVGGLAFAPDGATLYIAGYTLVAWDVADGRQRPLPWPEGAWAYGLAASPDGATLAVFEKLSGHDSDPWRLALFDVASGQRRAVPEANAPVAAAVFLPGGEALVTLGEDRVLRLWDVASARPLAARRFDDHFRLTTLAVSPDGRRIAAGGESSNWRFGVIAMAETDGTDLGPWSPTP